MNQEQLTGQKIKKGEGYIDSSYQSIGYLIFKQGTQGTIKLETDEEILTEGKILKTSKQGSAKND